MNTTIEQKRADATERPILFSGSMVRAILDGRKTQTRRVIKEQPPEEFQPIVERYCPAKVNKRTGEEYAGEEIFGAYDAFGDYGFQCPYGGPGDLLWVKETFARIHAGLLQHLDPEPDNGEPYNNGWSTVFRADGLPPNWEHYGQPWRPSIFMPRKMSRTDLEIVKVRVERLQEISEEDAKAEGVQIPFVNFPQPPDSKFKVGDPLGSYKDHFRVLWDNINGARDRFLQPKGPHRWELNPWVWVVEFRASSASPR
jgi:hypothetical protein